ncbi:WD40-repeat-containing domain protein [Xylogone sp. PMI_703]|nr:WD40-repeat-containing domain protein [Xylogone sp. PMI_703]
MGNTDSAHKAADLREIMRTAMNSTRHVVLPWVISCLAAEWTLLHPPLDSGVDCSGIIYIISRMEWYINLSRLFPWLELSKLEESWKDTEYDSLKLRIISLYKAILLYQIKKSIESMGQDVPHDQLIDTSELEVDRQAILIQEKALMTSFSRSQIEIRLHETFDTGESEETIDTDQDNETVTEEKIETDSETPSNNSQDALLANLHCDSIDLHIPVSETNNGNFLKLLHGWVLSTKEYQRFLTWDGENGCRVLWIAGTPSACKTMLLHTIVSNLSGETNDNPDSKRLAYFFCSNNRSLQGGATAVVKSLIWQVIKAQPLLIRHLKKQVELTDRNYFDDEKDFYAMSAVFCSMLKDEDFAPTYFIINVIDELSINVNRGSPRDCLSRSENRGVLDSLLGLVAATSRAPGYSNRVKWLVSFDRDEMNAKNTMADREYHLQLELDSRLQELREVSNQYIAYKIDEIAQHAHYRGRLQVAITEKLQEVPPENFLWIDMVCEVIKLSHTPWNTVHILEGLGKDVQTLYRQMKDRVERFEQDDQVYCKNILSTAVIALRPLRIEELVGIIDLPPEVDPEIIITQMCCPFLEVYNDSVYFRHHTARNFLMMDLKRSGKMTQETSLMIQRCLKNVSKVSKGVSDKGHGLVDYAIIFWITHLSKWEFGNSSLNGEAEVKAIGDAMTSVNEFLNDYSCLNHWLEILTGQELLSEALAQMKILEASLTEKIQLSDSSSHNDSLQSRLKDSPIRSLIQSIQDVVSLLSFHQLSESPADLNPNNSLLFYPTENTLRSREKLLSEGFPWLSTTHILSKPSEKSLEASQPVCYEYRDWVRCCAYSPDGQLIASAGDDRMVRLRDTETGLAQHTFDDFDYFEEYVYRVVFSGASAGLIAASSSRRIFIWDVSTAVQLNQLTLRKQGGTESEEPLVICDITLSIAGDKLAAATENGVMVWDIPFYTRQELPGEDQDMQSDDPVKCVRFSPGSGELLAWTKGENIILWDIPNHKMRHYLQGHMSGIDGLAFSPDSTRLASASDDDTVRVWDVNTGQQLHVLPDHSSYVVSVAFSPDETLLASASYDYTIRIWELSVLPRRDSDDSFHKPMLILEGHRTSVVSVSFSPQGQHLMSSSHDSTVRIWDIASTKQRVATPAGETQIGDHTEVGSERRHTKPICYLAFSSDGKIIASASDDGLVCLWDGDTGTYQRSLEGPDCTVTTLFFPLDSKLKILVSAYMASRIRVWKTDSGDCMYLEGHSDWARGAAISPNGRSVASASDDKTVRIWDISDFIDGKSNIKAEDEDDTNRVFSGHKDYVYCVAFSPDGRYLASGGDDYNIYIWDLTQSDKGDKDKPDKVLQDVELRQYIRAIVFMHDEQHLISSTENIMIWNWQEETLLKVINWVDDDQIRPIMTLQIDAQFPNVLLNEFGAWPLDMDTLLDDNQQVPLQRPAPPPWCPYGLSDDCRWITYRNEKVIFLPEQYGPSKGLQCRIHGRRMIIGADSGQVMLFKFSEDKHPKPLFYHG